MRRAQSVFFGLAAALALSTAVRLPAAWESGNALNHVSGAWITLADDLVHGTFYRPLHDPALGYGGTRFFPLVFALHAGLVRAGLPLLSAGYALSLAAASLVVLGAFLLLRRVGVARLPAAAFAALTLCGFAVQHGASAMRGDLLPVALSALGLAAAASPRRGGIVLAAVLFGLAFAAKPTSLTAPAAAVAWLALGREPRRAAGLAATTAALAFAVVAVTDAASSGRFKALLRACALGGAGVDDVLRAPARLFLQFVLADPAGFATVAAALAVAIVALRPLDRPALLGARSPLLLPVLWLAFAGAGVLAVFVSPGTGVNHLVETEVAAAVVLGAASASTGTASRLARLAAPAVAAAGVLLALTMFRADRSSSRLLEVRALLRAMPGGRILSEDPLVPILAGERPVLLDAWMVRLASEREPGLVRGLDAEISRGAYSAIVLFRDLGDPDADTWFANRNFGLGVVDVIRRTCRRAGGIGRYHLYVPAGKAPSAERPRVTTLGEPPRVIGGATAR